MNKNVELQLHDELDTELRLNDELKKKNLIDKFIQELPEYVNEWYLNLMAGDRSSATCYDYVIKIRHFLRFINTNAKEVKCSDITMNIISQYFISIKTKEYNGIVKYTSDSYKQTVWCAMNNFISYLYDMDYIGKNYMEHITKPKNNDLARINKHRILLNEDDFNNMIKAAKQNKLASRDLLILLLFMTTGMRKSALSEISINNISEIDKKLYIIDKGDKDHEYDLTDSVIDALGEWLIDRRRILRDNNVNTNALFVSIDGERLQPAAIYKIVKKHSEKALGYAISPHKLRSGFCSILYKQTGNIEFVRRAVGHSNVATTQRYIVTDEEEKKQSSNIMGSLLKI